MSKLPRDLSRKLDARSVEIDKSFQKKLKKSLFEGEVMAKKSSKLGMLLAGAKTSPLVLAIIAVLFVGTASAVVTNKRTNQARQQEIELPQDLEGVLGVDVIREIALQDVPAGSVTGIEIEEEEGALLYKVKFSDGTYRLYDAKTGVAVVKKDETSESDESVPSTFAAGVSLQEARTIAQNQRAGKTITKIELETEEGVVVYSVRFSDGGRVDVDATSGAVIRVRNGEEEKKSISSSSSSSSSDDSSDDSQDDDSSSSQSSDDSDDSQDDSNDTEDQEDEKDEDKQEDENESDNSGSGNRN